MNRKFHIKKGDLVQVLAGEDKGKQGKVLRMDTAKERALVEGINMVSKHAKPSSANPQGGIIKKEAPIHISNLNVVDPTTGKPTRVGRKMVEVEVSRDGKKETKTKPVRYAKKSGTELK